MIRQTVNYLPGFNLEGIERDYAQFQPNTAKHKLVVATMVVLGVTLAVILLLSYQRSPRVVFLGWDEAGQVQIYHAGINGSQTRQLTSEQSGVQDYDLSPDKQRIAYATAGEQETVLKLVKHNGSGLQQLLTCQRSLCQQVTWHPDGTRLTYERRDLGEDGIPGIPRLFWLDIASGQTSPVLEDPDKLSYGASFSPDGRWLSYVGSPDEGIFVFNFDTGNHTQIPSELGTPAIWSHDGQSLLFRNNQVVVIHGADDDDHQGHSHDFTLGVYLFLATISDNTIIPLSRELIVDDASAAWQPGGDWIAFGRKQPRTAMGRQLWLMRADGSEAHALTDDPAIHHGIPSWSEDGHSLLFQRFPVFEPDAKPSVWLYSLRSESSQQIIPAGFQPTWLQ